MPTFEITGPDGSKYRVTGPDGSTPEQALEQVRAKVGAAGKPGETRGNPDGAAPTPERAKMGAGEAALRGAASGVTFNFDDEIAGLYKASGIPEMLAKAPEAVRNNAMVRLLSPVVGTGVGAARMGYEAIAGEGDATKAYGKEVTAQRAAGKQALEDQPAAYYGGNVLGALMLPVGGALNAATLPARMGRGAIGGAVMGGLAGTGEGEGAVDRVAKGLTGIAIGTGVGAVAPPVVEGAIQVGRHVLTPVINAARGVTARGADAEAARRVVGAIDTDVRASPTGTPGLTPQEFTSTPTATLMDIGGATTRDLARSAANTSGASREILNATIDPRFEGQSPRVTGWLRNTFNFPDANATQAAIEQTARGVNRANYARAYQDGAAGLWSPELERLAGSDAVSGAMQRATRAAADEAIVGGHGAMNPRITFSPDGRIQFNRGPNGVPTYPDLQYWDLVRRELSDAAQRAGRGTSEARRLNNFANALNGELDNLVPSYRQARTTAAGFFGAENSLEAGQNFVMQNFHNDQARAALGRMTPTERQLFQDGFVSRFMETLNRVGDRRSIVNKIADNPAAREKLEIALGRQRANELEAMMRVEGVMDTARRAVQGNSTTAQQLTQLGLAGGAGTFGAYGGYHQDPATLGTAAVMGALAGGGRHIDQRVAARVAQMLVSNDPNILARGIMLTARNERLMNSLRSTDRRISAAGIQQTSGANVLPMQGAMPGRTDVEDQPAPRVVNQ